MSTYKHLADLLKICSILPALAIMPAMAEDFTSTSRVSLNGVEKAIGGEDTANISISSQFGNGVEALNTSTASLKATDSIFIDGGTSMSKINGSGIRAYKTSVVDANSKDIYIKGAKEAVSADSESSITINATNEMVLSAADVSSLNTAVVDASSDSSVSLNAKSLEITGQGYGVRAQEQSNVSIDTNTLDISGGQYGAYALGQGNVTINAGEANILGKYGVGAQNNTTNSEDALATLEINADKLNIQSDAVAIVALSQGVVDINAKDATIYSADDAITTRGNATTNINVGTDNITKMTGNINFNYNEATSKTAVDAKVNVDLVGEESFWTGNTIVSYDKKPDVSKLVVSNSNIKLKDGATWNATQIIDNADVEEYGYYYTALNNLTIDNGTVNIADTDRGIYVDNATVSDATFNGGPLTINDTLTVSGGTNLFNGDINGAGSLNIANGAIMNIGTTTVEQTSINIDGTLIASMLNADNYGKLLADEITTGENGKLQLAIGNVGTYDIFGDVAHDDITIDAGAAYVVTNNGADGVVIETKSVDKIAQDTGLSTNSANVVNVLANVDNEVFNTISLMAQQDLVEGNVQKVEAETAKLNPDDKPVAQAVATSVQNQVLSLAAGRMSGASVGRSGGDLADADYGVWVQGLYNRAKYNGKFDGNTAGISVGADTLIDGKYTLGIGYAYNDTDVDSNSRDTKIESNSIFLYGQYKPTQWYVNAALNYTMANYKESSDPYGVVYESEYDVNSFGGQIATGYDLPFGLTPEVGMRYLHVSQDAYDSLLGRVNGFDTDYLTGVAGVKYAFEIESDSELSFRPELRAAATYDFLSDSAVATITAPGNLSYVIDADRLSRLGGEFGIGLTAQYRGLEVSLNYDLDLHEDYTSQTGMLKFRYNF